MRSHSIIPGILNILLFQVFSLFLIILVNDVNAYFVMWRYWLLINFDDIMCSLYLQHPYLFEHVIIFLISWYSWLLLKLHLNWIQCLTGNAHSHLHFKNFNLLVGCNGIKLSGVFLNITVFDFWLWCSTIPQQYNLFIYSRKKYLSFHVYIDNLGYQCIWLVFTFNLPVLKKNIKPLIFNILKFL